MNGLHLILILLTLFTIVALLAWNETRSVGFPSGYLPPEGRARGHDAFASRLRRYAASIGDVRITFSDTEGVVLHWNIKRNEILPQCFGIMAVKEAISRYCEDPRIKLRGSYIDVSERGELYFIRQIDRLSSILDSAAERLFNGASAADFVNHPAIMPGYLSIYFQGNELKLGFIYEILRRYDKLKRQALSGCQAN